MIYSAMQVKGPGEVDIDGINLNLYKDNELLVSFDLTDPQYDTMQKLCNAIDHDPLISEAGAYQAYLMVCMFSDPSSKLVDSPRKSCDVEQGITLEINL